MEMLVVPWNAIISSANAAFNIRSYSGVLRSYTKEQFIAPAPNLQH
jgi:hypothetical protein